MRSLLLLGAILLCSSLGGAAEKKPLTAAQILDEVIVRPGDFDQMCDAPPPLPFGAPPIPAFGISVSQDLFLSDEMKDKLKARRADIVKELAARFEKYDWLKPPPAPPVSKKALFLKPEPGNTEFDATKPSGYNPRAMGGIILTIAEDLDAVELLPHFLKLEDDLHQMTQKALRDEKAPVPQIQLGGSILYQGMLEEFKDIEDWDKAPAALKRKKRLFESLVFDRQLLGVMLELLQHENYAPLKDSTPALFRVMTLKKKPLDEDMAKIKGPQDIPENERRYIFFDKELGIPYWRHEHAELIYSEPMREEVRALVQSYVNKTAPSAITGAALLDEMISHPGGYNQMCMMPAPMAFDAPVPAYGFLAPRHFLFSSASLQKLQAHRQKVIPVLLDRLHAVDLAHAPVENFNSLTLQAVRTLHGIETLPELLRLEDQLHTLLATAKQDEKAPLPDLNLDSPVVWANDDGKRAAGSSKENARKMLEFKCRIFQRELSGLVAKLLRDEDFAPFLATTVEKEYAAGLRKIAADGELKDIKTEQDIPYESRGMIVWDKKVGVPVSQYGVLIKVPYTESLRDEVRRVAEDFLKTVPLEKRKGEAAMELITQ